MNKLIFMFLIMLSLGHAAATFSINTDRSGLSSVTLSIEGDETVSVILPLDAGNFRIVGGTFTIVNDTAVVDAGETGFTTFSFSTGLLTTKTTSGWKLLFSPPEHASVRVYMPSYAVIEDSVPQPLAVSSEDSRTVIEFGPSEQVTVNYRVEVVPSSEEFPVVYLLGAALIITIGAIAASLLSRKGAKGAQLKPAGAEKPAEREPSLEITSGKKEMMETFNENDMKIVNYLLANAGKSRRNELERKTGISKSSLAMALNRLEKRKIVQMDRTATTHFVKLTDYFLKL